MTIDATVAGLACWSQVLARRQSYQITRRWQRVTPLALRVNNAERWPGSPTAAHVREHRELAPTFPWNVGNHRAFVSSCREIRHGPPASGRSLVEFRRACSSSHIPPIRRNERYEATLDLSGVERRRECQILDYLGLL
jgi:hypothetical protein